MQNILKITLASAFTISLLTLSSVTGYSGPAYACPEGCEEEPEG
jgi:hypothetical protein